jgi:GABA permease
MRAPIRSEPDMFHLTIGAVLVIAASLAVGALATPVAGVVVLVVALVIAAVAYVVVGQRDRPAVLRAAAREPHPHGAPAGVRHVLVIANETLAGDELRERIATAGGERVEVDVLAPVLTSHLHLGVSDVDRELAAARTRLRESLDWAREHGITAHGKVGDPSPTTAIEDELRDFGADEVIVVTHARERETWQERGELQRLRSELDVPVTHLVVDAA